MIDQDAGALLDLYADPVRQALRFARCKMHQTGLVGELTVEVRGTGKTTPRFDAQEGRSAGLRPQSQLAKTLPGDLDRRTGRRRVPHGRARWPV
jgi:hypothetical protein